MILTLLLLMEQRNFQGKISSKLYFLQKTDISKGVICCNFSPKCLLEYVCLYNHETRLIQIHSQPCNKMLPSKETDPHIAARVGSRNTAF